MDQQQTRPPDDKESEAALHAAHARTTAILESIADAFFSVDDAWRFVMVNPTAARAPFGRPASELLGKVIWELFPALVGTRIQQHYFEAVEGRRMVHYEAQSPLSGQWFEVFMNPRTGGLDVYLRDISKRKRAEMEREELLAQLTCEKERVEAILEGMRDAFFTLDAAWRITRVNRQQERVFRLAREQTLGRVFWEVWPEAADPGSKYWTECHRVAQTRVPSSFLEYFAPLDLWTEVDVYPAEGGGVAVFFRDVSERVSSREALRRSEERDRVLAETMLQGVVHQDRDGIIISMNPAAERILGKTRDEFLGSTSIREEHDCIREDGTPFPGIEHPSMVALRTGQPVRETVMGVFNPREGAVRWISIDAVPVFRPGEDTPHQVYTMFSDITERKLAEEALREADRRKNEFLAVLSHELRNPLTPIRNSLFIIERAAPGSRQARRAWEIIERQTGQLTRLVDDLLDITRISRNKVQLKLRPLDLSELVRRTVEDHRSLFEERGIQLEQTPAAERLMVHGDEARLAQVVGNILHNAAKFTPRDGHVRVVAEKVAAGGRASIRVIDDGAGIDEAMLRRLFEPFTQADATLDRSRGGLGLGLALVKGMVELHGGEVHAHSDGPGTGAELVVELPLDQARLPEAPSSAVTTARGGRRVLIIEDNIDAADSLREVLELDEHVVEVAYTGPEGLAAALDFKPEVVLCDIGLPGMDGFDVARALRANASLAGTLLVALSGYALPEDVQRATEAGFHRHMAKPPSLASLTTLLASLPGAPPRPQCPE